MSKLFAWWNEKVKVCILVNLGYCTTAFSPGLHSKIVRDPAREVSSQLVVGKLISEVTDANVITKLGITNAAVLCCLSQYFPLWCTEIHLNATGLEAWYDKIWALSEWGYATHSALTSGFKIGENVANPQQMSCRDTLLKMSPTASIASCDPEFVALFCQQLLCFSVKGLLPFWPSMRLVILQTDNLVRWPDLQSGVLGVLFLYSITVQWQSSGLKHSCAVCDVLAIDQSNIELYTDLYIELKKKKKQQKNKQLRVPAAYGIQFNLSSVLSSFLQLPGSFCSSTLTSGVGEEYYNWLTWKCFKNQGPFMIPLSLLYILTYQNIGVFQQTHVKR